MEAVSHRLSTSEWGGCWVRRGGGYIIAYIGCAFVTGLIIERFGKSFAALMAAMYAGWAVVYVLGTLWYMYLARVGLVPALLVCVVPFLLGDAVKTVLCATLINRLSERGLLRDEL